jgi:hypothetical protein
MEIINTIPSAEPVSRQVSTQPQLSWSAPVF